MRILVTGASGFLGRHLLPLLAGHEVFALVRKRVENLDTPVEAIEADLSRPLDSRILPRRMDAIIHLAQSSLFRDFPASADDVFAVNVAAPAALIRWAVDAGVTRALFASTGTVYEPFAGPLCEDVAVNPTSYYGATKLACETLTLAYQSKISVSHFRIFFLYGPTQTGMMMSRLIDAVRSGAPITLPREGNGLVLSPTYITDAAQVMRKACVEGWRGVYNLAGTEAVSFGGLADRIGAIAGRSPVIVRSEAPPPAPIVADVTKLARSVDTSGFVRLTDGLKLTMRIGAT